VQTPHSRRLVWPIATYLALAPGCAWVHQRQSFYPNKPNRVVNAGDKSGKDQPPRVNLRVSPEWGPDRIE